MASRMVRLCVAAFLALMLAGIAYSQPACPPGVKDTYEWVNPADNTQKIRVMVPTDRHLCPAEPTGGCCETIEIQAYNLPGGWRVEGPVSLSAVFTTACGNGLPIPPLQIWSKTVNQTESGGRVSVKICYPPAHSWKSFEQHVDFSLRIYTAAGTMIDWIGADQVYAKGVIGPGGLDYDPVCRTLGCTPGYWKNHPESWPGQYGVTDLFATAFGVAPSAIFSPGLTLMGALRTGGGGEKAMVRHCTASLLSAQTIANNPWEGSCSNYTALTPGVGAVQANVQAAYAGTKSFEEAHQFCAYVNESLCPFNGVWLGTDNNNSECASTNPGTPCNPL